MAEPDLRAHVVEDLDQLPDPNYDDFFEAHREAPLGLDSPLRLLFETSRGCWWGEKHHCTFCGLNGETMAYRSKSATHALNELRRLLTRYPDHPIEVVDNILDMRYFRDFLPELAQSDLKAELFYEVKSNLKKDQVRALRDAGVTRIQAGIESLSDSVLDLMRKGVSALQNIQLLKWGGEFGVKIQWNLLSGFPGEPAEEYERMSELVPSLTHLEPPDGCFNIRIDRFSPNFDEAGERGFTDVRPYPAYYLVYPFAPEAVSRLAYYFTYDYAEPRDVGAYTETLRRRIEQWSAEHARSVLASVDREEGRLFLLDTRSVAKRPVYAFDGLDRFLYASCDRIQRPASLCRTRASNGHPEPAVEEVRDRLDRFVEDRLMVTQDDRYLALAVGTSELEAI